MIGIRAWFLLAVTVVVATTLIAGDDGCNPVTSPTAPTVDPTDCTNYPDTPEMNNELRNFILDTFNGYRSRLAKGLHKGIGATFPSGKNINKALWDCRIEAAAKKASEVCYTETYPDFQTVAYGQRFFRNASAYESPKRAMELLIYEIFRLSVGQLREENNETTMYISSNNAKYMVYNVESFACWFGSKNCNSEFDLDNPNSNISAVCGISPATCPYVNRTSVCSTIYVLGAPCAVDSDCTNPNGFTKCDAALGLCTKTSTPATTLPPTTPPPTTLPSTPPPTTTAPSNPCPTGTFFYSPNNSCYRYVNGANRSQAQAEQWCVNQGKKGHLVSIHNEAEENYVKSLIPSGGDKVLIGYNNQAWSDATPVDYSNFMAGNGNNACATLSLPTYQWKSIDCNGPFKQFICKRNL